MHGRPSFILQYSPSGTPCSHDNIQLTLTVCHILMIYWTRQIQYSCFITDHLEHVPIQVLCYNIILVVYSKISQTFFSISERLMQRFFFFF
jgi:hypothetical protein